MTYNKINDIISAKDAILQHIITETKIIRPEVLVDALFTQPFTKVTHLTQRQQYAENTARNYLDELSRTGILEKRIIQGSSYYLNLELYWILSE